MDQTKSLQTITPPIEQFSFFNKEHMEIMQRTCIMFASSELVPPMYQISATNPKDKAVANCMIALEMASRIGASPLMVMQNLYLVYGKPGWSSKFLVATVNTCGRFEPLEYKRRVVGSCKGMTYVEKVKENGTTKYVTRTIDFEMDDVECVAFTRKKGSEVLLESIPVTLSMAIKEGWYGKDGSKWKTMPLLMLQYRAASFWTSAYSPEISMGMKTSEEIFDITDIDYEEVATKVKQEIDKQANKEAITINPIPAQPEGPTPTPAPETSLKQDPGPEDKTATPAPATTENGNVTGETKKAPF